MSSIVRRLGGASSLLLLALALAGAGPGSRLTVVVFPLTGSNDTGTADGRAIASVLSARLAAGTGIAVVPAPADTTRASFLTTARSLGADYYVSGFVTPVGPQVAVIEQVVSARTGISVYRQSETLSATADAASTGDQMRALLLATTVVQAPPVAATAAPSAPRSSAAAPSLAQGASTPVRPPEPPAIRQRAVVLTFAGDPNVDSAVYNVTALALVDDLSDDGLIASQAPVTGDQVAKVAFLLCSQTGADKLFGGTVETRRLAPELAFGFDATVNVQSSSCSDLNARPASFSGHATSGDLTTAIKLAVQDALRGYPRAKEALRP